ncbi:S41 family peptidase [Rummeliibacillus sp. NPDC094406]|uniref:S41 family peptidase n=1 Tax=Rummeliibacillus sp. NPDC094406 TaxID=3364511 RepID=UPI00381DD739
MKTLRIFLASVMAMMLFFTSSFAYAAEPLNEVKSIVKEHYYPKVPTDALNSKTIKDLMKQLDPYSIYLTKDEYQSFMNSINMELVGIGVTTLENKKGLKITSIIKGSPASKSGLKAGDIITKVDGESIAGKSTESTLSLLIGKENTTVNLTIYRSSTNTTFAKELTRKVISLPNVEKEKLAGKIGYIRLNSFSEGSAKEIQDAIKSMPEMKDWIFDIRSNGGGYVGSAQEVIGLFPTAKHAFLYKLKGTKMYGVDAIKQKVQWNAPVSILTDKYTASASEMTAAAAKDLKLAKIYGQTTFGKGVMQEPIELSDGSFLKLTIAEFFGPKNYKINQKGIKPDVPTAIGKEVEKSHSDFLLKQLKNYNKLTSIENGSASKSISLKASKNLSWNTMKNANVYLWQIGGVSRKISLKLASGKKLIITPSKQLKPGTKYYLVVQPKKKNEKGAYSKVTIK